MEFVTYCYTTTARIQDAVHYGTEPVFMVHNTMESTYSSEHCVAMDIGPHAFP